MQIDLAPEEAALLRRVVERTISELRGEIAGTENYDWRNSLKADEAVLKAVLERLH